MNLHMYLYWYYYSNREDNEGNYHANMILSKTGTGLDQETTLDVCHVENGGKNLIASSYTIHLVNFLQF